jgi:hypothetical protein
MGSHCARQHGPPLKFPQAQGPTPNTAPVSTRSSGRSSFEEEDPFGLGTGLGLDRFRNLTNLKWGEFESMGFSGLVYEKKLQFDLTQGVGVTMELFTMKTTAAAVAAAPPVPVAAANVSSPALDVSMSIRTESGSTTHHQAESSTTATTTTPSTKRLPLFRLPVVASPGGGSQGRYEAGRVLDRRI